MRFKQTCVANDFILFLVCIPRFDWQDEINILRFKFEMVKNWKYN